MTMMEDLGLTTIATVKLSTKLSTPLFNAPTPFSAAGIKNG